MKFTAAQIAGILEGTVEGDPEIEVSKLAKIEEGSTGSLTFLANPKYTPHIYNTEASIVIVNNDFVAEHKVQSTLIRVEDAYKAFSKLLEYYNQVKLNKSGIEQPCFISETAKYGENLYLGAFSYLGENVRIGNNVKIGSNCTIHPNVTIYNNTVIGDNVIIHAGVILGGDAFYYKKRPEGFDQLKSGGRVVIEDNVDIGAGTTIDKGVTADTTIGRGTKIDNQVHIGHDTVLGEKVLIAAQTTIAGCVVIEDEVTLWGQVGVTSGITVGAKAVISAQSGISKSLEGGKSYFGSPAGDFRTKYKELAALRQVQELLDKLKQN